MKRKWSYHFSGTFGDYSIRNPDGGCVGRIFNESDAIKIVSGLNTLDKLDEEFDSALEVLKEGK